MKTVTMIGTVIGFLLMASISLAVTITVDFTGTISSRHAGFVGPNYTPGAPEVAGNPQTSITGQFSYNYEDVATPTDTMVGFFPASNFSMTINDTYLYQAATGAITIGRADPYDSVFVDARVRQVTATPLASDLAFNLFLVPKGGRFPSFDHSAFAAGNILTTWDVGMFYSTGSIGNPGLWLYGVNDPTNMVFEVDSLASYPPVPEPSTLGLVAVGLMAALSLFSKRGGARWRHSSHC